MFTARNAGRSATPWTIKLKIWSIVLRILIITTNSQIFSLIVQGLRTKISPVVLNKSKPLVTAIIFNIPLSREACIIFKYFFKHTLKYLLIIKKK